MTKRRSQIKPGLILASEQITHVESIALGIWFKCGSRDESPSQSGLTHFIEHCIFKGTRRRNAKALAEAFDALGCSADAFTSKEETCFSIRVLADQLQPALDLLLEMVTQPVFPAEELDRERQVILEEIKMEEDDAEESAYEHTLRQSWAGHPISVPILGPVENVLSFSRAQVTAFYQQQFLAPRLVVAAAGKLDHMWLHDRLSRAFELKGTLQARQPAPLEPRPFRLALTKSSLEQVNFCFNFPGLHDRHPLRPVERLLAQILGGGISSRLFQKIREERGLAYHIDCFSGNYSDCGHFTIYGGCSPERFEEVLSLCLLEVADLASGGVLEQELARAKTRITSSVTIGSESVYARANSLAKFLISHDTLYDLAAFIKDIQAVELDQVVDLAGQLFKPESLGIVTVGEFDQRQLEKMTGAVPVSVG